VNFDLFDDFNEPIFIIDSKFEKIYENKAFSSLKNKEKIFDEILKQYNDRKSKFLNISIDGHFYRVKVNIYQDKLIFELDDRTGINQFIEKFFTLNAIINQAPVGIIITDKNGNIKYVNRGFEKMTGFSFNDVSGKNPRIWKSGEHDKEYYKNLWDTVLAGEKWVGEFINRKKDGSLYIDRSVIFPIFDSMGEIIEICAIKHDITEMKILEKNLIQNEKNITLGRFVGNIAHDMKNILTGIFSLCDYLKSKDFSDDVKVMIEQIYKYANVMNEFVLSLKDIGKKENIIKINFCDYVYENKDFYRRIIGKNIKINVDCKCACVGLISKTHIDQIFLNLLVNARDAIFEKFNEGNGGIINISIYCLNDNIIIELSDNGCGIPEELMDKIFSLSFTTKDDGTGVGLFIVKNIVEQYGGTIEVESKVDEGTTFRLMLPIIYTIDKCKCN